MSKQLNEFHEGCRRIDTSSDPPIKPIFSLGRLNGRRLQQEGANQALEGTQTSTTLIAHSALETGAQSMETMVPRGGLGFEPKSPVCQEEFFLDLDEWALRAEGREMRTEAVRRIKRAFNRGSTDLLLSSLELRSLPDSIGQLQTLSYLSLWCNQLPSLPDTIGNLRSLRSLDLSINKLQALPESIGNLPFLNSLHIDHNQLQTLPVGIGRLQALTLLDAKRNRLQTLPISIGNLQDLQELRLEGNGLQTLPESVGDLQALKVLRLAENPLQILPESLNRLQKLETLSLGSNPIKVFPKCLSGLPENCTFWPLSIKGSHISSKEEFNKQFRSQVGKCTKLARDIKMEENIEQTALGEKWGMNGQNPEEQGLNPQARLLVAAPAGVMG